MSDRANSIVYHGVKVKKTDLPWRKVGMSFDDWWLKEEGLDVSSLHTQTECRDFFEQHPIPLRAFEGVDGEYIALAVPGTITWVEGEEIKEIDLHIELRVKNNFCRFLRKYSRIEYKESPRWYLIGYYG